MQEQRNSVACDARGSNGTVAGITSTLRTAVTVAPENGLNHASVVNLADIQTIRQMDLGRHVGYLFPRGEPALRRRSRGRIRSGPVATTAGGSVDQT